MKVKSISKVPRPSEKIMRMRPPFAYYGGKQNMVNKIVPKIPPHTLYCEPFCGGAAIFFAKQPSKIEVLNDTNKELINFYRVCKARFEELQYLVRTTLHSRAIYDDALVIYYNPHLFDEVRRAWAIWITANMGFSSQLGGSWGYDRSGKNCTSLKIANNRRHFIEEYAERLETCQLEATDAIKIIESRDGLNSFFYVDPPYFNANMGHYDGYTYDDFEKLLQALEGIKGRFLLSSYDSGLLQRYVAKNKWKQERHSYLICVDKGRKDKIKEEVLTWAN